MTPQWVITYQIESRGEVLVTEFYRGSRDECVRILVHSGDGSDDLCRTGRWKAILSTAQSWDEFLTLADDNDNEVVFVGPWR